MIFSRVTNKTSFYLFLSILYTFCQDEIMLQLLIYKKKTFCFSSMILPNIEKEFGWIIPDSVGEWERKRKPLPRQMWEHTSAIMTKRAIPILTGFSPISMRYYCLEQHDHYMDKQIRLLVISILSLFAKYWTE